MIKLLFTLTLLLSYSGRSYSSGFLEWCSWLLSSKVVDQKVLTDNEKKEIINLLDGYNNKLVL
jgi:hypothetical protein